jgi:hypothetical protein
VIVLDKAGFHKAKRINQHQQRWQDMGLSLWFQPPYSPQFNFIETVGQNSKPFCYLIVVIKTVKNSQLLCLTLFVYSLLPKSRIVSVEILRDSFCLEHIP